MNELVALLALVAALGVGVISPGPSFVLVARTAVAQGRTHGVAASLGMGLGGALFALAALLGLQTVFSAVPSIYIGLKALGGAYLCYLGYRIFQGAKQALIVNADGSDATQLAASKAFWLGLTTQVSNPKTAIIYASVFAAILPAKFSLGFGLAVIVAVFVIETAWYALVALVLSSAAPRRAYLGYKAWFDRAAGLVMTGLGIRLITSLFSSR